MNRLFAKTSVCKLAAAALFTSVALLVTGCGMGNPAGPAANNAAGGTLTGHVMGGATPITGATVEIWVTGNGYGTGATVMGSTTTNGSGVFNFSGNYTGGSTCTNGQYVYMTSTGGSAGGGANTDIAEVAALGRCEDFYTPGTNTYIGPATLTINELTTIAAANALGHFSSEATGAGGNGATGSGLAILIGAPLTNNAPQIGGISTGCVKGSALNGSCGATTVTAGLYHAFLNAANLVNIADGSARAQLPNGGIVPQAFINHLGNIMSACVNSAGGAAASATPCGLFLGAGTLVVAAGTSTPTDTFGALVNINVNPTLIGSTTSLANFYAIATAASNIYTPDLAAATAIIDWSIAIDYPTGLGATTVNTQYCNIPPCQGMLFPDSGALDINDNFYVGNVSTATTGNVNLLAFSSNGILLGETTTGPGTDMKVADGLALDSIGNGYIANGSSGGSGANLFAQFSYTKAAAMSNTYTPISFAGGISSFMMAVDKQDNVWAYGPAASGVNVFEAAAPGTGAVTSYTVPTTAVASSKEMGFTIDANQNIWVDSTNTVAVLENTGTLLAPTYSNSSVFSATAATSVTSAITFFSGGGAEVESYQTGPMFAPYTFTLDNSGAGPGITGITPGTPVAPVGISGVLVSNETDGNNNIWEGETNGKALAEYDFTFTTPFIRRYNSCIVGAQTALTCSTENNAFGGTANAGKPLTVSIDSTGSVWVVYTASGNVAQFIGVATPTVPLRSLGTFGTKP